MNTNDPMMGTMLLAYPVPGGTANLHDHGLLLSTPGGRISVRFAFPAIGRPAFPLGTGEIALLAPEAVTAVVYGAVSQPWAMVQEALTGRLGLRASGTGADAPVVPIAVELAGTGESDGQPAATFRLRAPLADRVLYDLVAAGESGWRTVAAHALYHRADWASFGLAHITDTHVARRIDSFRPTLHALGRHEAADKAINWNDRFRGFVRWANLAHDSGDLDVIVATGDLIDYQYERGDDPLGAGNAEFLRSLILGTAPGPDFPGVEELRVPMLLTPGNHDYRRYPYRLVFDVEVAGIGVTRIRNFAGYHLLEADAAALDNALYDPGADEVASVSSSTAADMVAVDTTMRGYRDRLAEPGSVVVELGPHRLVLLDSAHDVGMVTSPMDGLRAWLGLLDEDEATFVGGSPNCEGISDEEYAMAADALASAPPEGLVIVALHAPLVNVWNGEYPYFLRESARPAHADQAWWFVARHTRPLASLDSGFVRGRHPHWFAPNGAPEPTYLSRTDSQDLLDFGVSRGRTDDLLAALAGRNGTRAADVVLAGHTHHHNEVAVRVTPDGELAYTLDFYTANPDQYYPARMVTADDVNAIQRSAASNPPRYRVSTTTSYVHVDDDAVAGMTPWQMPYAAHHPRIVQVPPYPDPLDRSTDPRGWWDRHRPLLLQTGALGPLENHQVSFAGLRLMSVRDNVIAAVRWVGMERLERHGFVLPVDQATAPEPVRPVRHRDRSVRFGFGRFAGRPTVSLLGANPGHSLVCRDDAGALVELWDVPGSFGAGRLAGPEVAPPAAGEPMAYLDPLGMRVVLYRATDGHVHSLYWQGTAAARHDALSASGGAPGSAGRPAGYALAGMNHVIYRRGDGHLHELYWAGADPVGHGSLTEPLDVPLAAGDPAAYGVTATGQSIVLYRGEDGHIHSLYWADGPTGHDNLSGYVGTPPAAGEPVGYHRADDNSHQVVYRGVDGHLHEIWWVGEAPAAGWDLVAATGAPAAAADPCVWFVPETGRKHVGYASADGHVHDLSWAPGGPPVWTDLTLAALAPPAALEAPVGWSEPGSATSHLGYRGADGALHEIRWT